MKEKFKVKLLCGRCGFEFVAYSTSAKSKEAFIFPLSGDRQVIGTTKWLKCKNCKKEVKWEGGFESSEPDEVL